MNPSSATTLEPPRFETSSARLIAGVRESYAFSDQRFKQGIPAQWQRLVAVIGQIPGVSAVAYGLCFDMFGDEPGFDYVAGTEAAAVTGLPEGISHLQLPALTCAVFAHRLHASQFNQTMDAIMREWLPTSGYQLMGGDGAPDLIERYGGGFDPQTGLGDMELWLPVRRA
ncbi:GyrI-like domain-containing protein [Bradyrhizobium prioriisuperbiae]|uniref:GyrI-like domain-containing protein n=1 Tax=Bradyrhizobium prioriisuperbiae TaxID=2854389 RepID=UPI0028EFDFAF|nr:GyrI-like domain-containing protein [Bradyrhizobium prioritasuperba]